MDEIGAWFSGGKQRRKVGGQFYMMTPDPSSWWRDLVRSLPVRAEKIEAMTPQSPVQGVSQTASGPRALQPLKGVQAWMEL